MQHLVNNGGYLTRDTFLCEQNMYSIVGKLVKETYKKHENDADSVHMWGRENPNLFIYYQESGLEIGGELIGTNVLFTIEIQSPLVVHDDATIWSSECDYNQCYIWNK